MPQHSLGDHHHLYPKVAGLVNLAVVVDLYARRVVGWSMAASLSRELVLDALLIAVLCRKPHRRVVVHSGQGNQYGSDDFRRFCQAHNLEPGMSRRDNAVVESFFGSLKETDPQTHLQNPGSGSGRHLRLIEALYNRTRRHTHLGGASPEALESAAA